MFYLTTNNDVTWPSIHTYSNLCRQLHVVACLPPSSRPSSSCVDDCSQRRVARFHESNHDPKPDWLGGRQQPWHARHDNPSVNDNAKIFRTGWTSCWLLDIGLCLSRAECLEPANAPSVAASVSTEQCQWPRYFFLHFLPHQYCPNKILYVWLVFKLYPGLRNQLIWACKTAANLFRKTLLSTTRLILPPDLPFQP